MKYTILLIISFLPFSTFAGSSPIDDLPTKINRFEGEILSNDQQTLFEISQKVRLLYNQLGVNTVIKRVKSDINRIQREILVKTEVSDQKNNSGLNFLFDGINVQTNEFSSVDFTKIVDLNTNEFLRDLDFAQEQFTQIQAYLQSYVEDNHQKISEMKLLTSIFINLAIESSKQEGNSVFWLAEEAQQLSWMALRIRFSGKQEITRCVQVKHISHEEVKRSTSKAGASFLFWLLRGNTEHQSETKTKMHSYTEKNCEPETKLVNVYANDSIHQLNYAYLDQKIKSGIGYLELYLTLNEEHVYPTFGNPYLNYLKWSIPESEFRNDFKTSQTQTLSQ